MRLVMLGKKQTDGTRTDGAPMIFAVAVHPR
jgi:hypothetical protein